MPVRPFVHADNCFINIQLQKNVMCGSKWSEHVSPDVTHFHHTPGCNQGSRLTLCGQWDSWHPHCVCWNRWFKDCLLRYSWPQPFAIYNMCVVSCIHFLLSCYLTTWPSTLLNIWTKISRGTTPCLMMYPIQDVAVGCDLTSLRHRVRKAWWD